MTHASSTPTCTQSIPFFDRLARRVHELATSHVELYIDSRDLGAIADQVANLPAVSIDHLGLHRDGLIHLLRLVERGAKVEATGFGHLYLDRHAIEAIVKIDPTALMPDTDLPSTRACGPFETADLDLVAAVVGTAHASAVLWHNEASSQAPARL